MKKDREWAFMELGKLYPTFTEMRDDSESITVTKCELLNKAYDILRQLDVSEVLSQEWIEDNSLGAFELEGTLDDIDEKFVSEHDLKGLLVPSQEKMKASPQETKRIKELESYNDELIRDNNQLRNALDNQEVLSQEWIDNNSVNASSDGVTEEYVHVDDLENLIIPKQELPLIPKFAAEWIEKAKETEYPLAYAINQTSGELGKWLHTYYQNVDIRKNQELFARAWLYGYTVEVEQKYVLPIDENHALCKFTNVVWGIHKEKTDKLYLEDYFKFTEQEIKDYDERFWAFAVKVEEMEE